MVKEWILDDRLYTPESFIEHVSRDIYLHFLDRELMTTIAAYDRMSEILVLRDVHTILFSTYEPLYLSMSLVMENRYARALFETLTCLFQVGQIELAMNSPSMYIFSLSKKAQYPDKTEYYLCYHDDTWKYIEDFGPTYLWKRTDTSKVLEKTLISDLDGNGATDAAKRLGIQIDPREIDRLIPYLIESVENRKGRAVTKLLFQRPYEQFSASIQMQLCFGIKISEHYVKAYMAERGGTIATGLTCSTGANYFDYLCPTYPFHHIDLWRQINHRLGVSAFVENASAEDIAIIRSVPSFQYFVDEIRLFLAKVIRLYYLEEQELGNTSQHAPLINHLASSVRSHLRNRAKESKGIDEYIRTIEQAVQQLSQNELSPRAKFLHGEMAMLGVNKSVKIFLSHSKEDEDLAKRIIQVLEESFVIPEGVIRCTSVPGYRLSIGAHTSTALREELRQTELIIGLLTKHSLRSSYVLFELGAGWGMGKWIVPLLHPDVKFSDMPGPLKEEHAIHFSDKGGLFQLIDNVSRLQFNRRSSDRVAGAIDSFILSL